MYHSSGLSDLQISFLGSLCFWTTAAGITIRTLKLDFNRLETFLQQFYKRADQINFDVKAISNLVTEWIVKSLYRDPHHVRYVTFVMCLVINTVSFFHMWFYWEGHKTFIEQTLAAGAKQANPEYYDLISKPAGKNLVSRALDDNGDGDGLYVNNDTVSMHIRNLNSDFETKYAAFVGANNLNYLDVLDSLFGAGYSSGGWDGNSLFFPLFVFGFSTLTLFAVDVVAVFSTLGAYRAIVSKGSRPKAVFFAMVTVVSFLFSFANYNEIFEGKIWSVFLLPIYVISVIICSYILILAAAGFIGLIALLVDRNERILAAVLIIPVIFLVCIAFFLLNQMDIYHLTIRNFSMVSNELLSRRTIWATIVSMPALYPAIVLLSARVLVILFKVLFTAVKEILLGQIYGASILSGGTFFVGFLMALITSTAAAWTLITLLKP